jgi:hypothetical protein
MSGFTCSFSFAGELIFARSAADGVVPGAQITLASRFYGVDVRTIILNRDSDSAELLRRLQSRDTLAAAITTKALLVTPKDGVLAALHRPRNQKIPLLIIGITPETDARKLIAWSNGVIAGCREFGPETSPATYVFGTKDNITRQLGSEEVPAVSGPVCTLAGWSGRGDVLISAQKGKRSEPVFVRVVTQTTNIFFLAGTTSAAPIKPRDLSLRTVFPEIAPVMMFVSYAAGDRAWHSVGHYANLSIDDPWLVEPYGHLSYEALLTEMERHNFHTTIAFIPWNFDRSSAGVAALFRAHPDRFSICVHGNNHDHAEFTDYDEVSLDTQIANIEQAIARMERFKVLTGIPYDRVMVFPHTTGPELTMAELKKYGFLATAYSLDLPLGSPRPTDPLFFLRTFDLKFANLTGLKRYSAEVGASRWELAADAFLENPILFYGHENTFDAGIHAFDSLADTVNSLQPDTRWCSLGCVAQHLYREKLRDDGNFDAEIFSSDVILESPSRQDKTFNVSKTENFMPPIESVTIDGQVRPFTRSGTLLLFSVSVPAGASRHVQIHYLNNWDVEKISVAKTGVRVAILRRISDFRDMTLSRSSWGHGLTRFYYQENLNSIELKIERVLPEVALVVILLALVAVGPRARRRIKRAEAGKRN